MVTFPAKSEALPVTTCPAPSVVTITGLVTLPTPDRASAAVKLTVTLVLFHPLAFGGGLAVLVNVGGVKSMLMPDTVAEAELPAVS